METGETNGGFEADKLSVYPAGLQPDRRGSTNLHTYIHEPNKSLSGYTIEALPADINYRRLSGVHVDQRPTMEELMIGKKFQENQDEEASKAKEQQKGKVIKFGWIEGVFKLVLLSVWGVMLFLRLTWVMGQAGLIQGLLIITLCNIVTGITALSMSAVATNGQIASGGVYYMISRALGPEFGGAIGILFTIANSISVATTTLGFCDSLLDLVYEVSEFSGIVADEENRVNDLRIIGTPVLTLLLILAIIGMDWVNRVQGLLLLLLVTAQIDMFTGSFIKGDSLYVKSNERHAKGFTGWSLDTLKNNINGKYTAGDDGSMESFISVFGVFFTSVTGITAGANISGDLRDPASAIPKGTLLGIFVTYITYMIFGAMVTFTYEREASGNIEEILDTSGKYPSVGNCTAEANAVREFYNLTETSCKFGTAHDQRVMTYISATGYLVYIGCYGATLSSAIASLIGAPRVLQAVGKDKLYPLIHIFAKGHGANNDPFRGYILVFLIAFGCLMIGELNAIGKLSSNFFLASYSLMNLSVFHSSMTKSPGWRPSFKYYNPWVSLVGSIVCLGLMLIVDWKLACATYAAIAVLYGFSVYLKPDVTWGSSSEALVYVNALNNAYTLNDQKHHVKTYRPQILLLSGNPTHRQPLVDFANLITKKLSLLVCSHIIRSAEVESSKKLQDVMECWFKDHNIKSFYTISVNDSISQGAQNSILMTGLGKLRPNLVMLGYHSKKDDFTHIEEYYNVLTIAFENNMSVSILRLPNGTDFSEHIGFENTTEKIKPVTDKRNRQDSDKTQSTYRDPMGNLLSKSIVDDIQQFRKKSREGYIDVWWLYDDGGLTILLPYILQTRKQFADCKLRVFSLSNRPEDFDSSTRNLANLLSKFRIDYTEVEIIPDITKKAQAETKEEFDKLVEQYPAGSIEKSDLNANMERTNRHLRTAELLREKSMSSELVVITLPLPRKGQCSPALYMAWLEMLTKGLPPVLLVRGNQSSVLTYYS